MGGSSAIVLPIAESAFACALLLVAAAVAAHFASACAPVRNRRFGRGSLRRVRLPHAVALSLFVLAFVRIGGGKTNGVDRGEEAASAPPMTMVGAGQDGESVGEVDRARFTAITVSPLGVSLVLHRPADRAADTAAVVVCATTNLLDETGWSALGVVAFPSGETNVAHVVSPDGLSAFGAEESCFFAFVEYGDSDGDGLENWYESLVSRTDPHSVDTDGDGLDDGLEWDLLHTDPLAADLDSDGDGLPDVWETACGLDPLVGDGPMGGAGDPDGDGLDNLEELARGTSPMNPDTDGDGASDADECARFADGAIPRFDLSRERNLLAGRGGVETGGIVVELPFPVQAGGFLATNAVVCPEGAVAFVPMGAAAIFDASGGFPGHAAVWSETNVVVALRWGDFALDEESTIVAAPCYDGTNAWFVVEYGDVLDSDGNRASMRLAVCEAAPGDVFVDHFFQGSWPSSQPETSGLQTPGRTLDVRQDYDDPILWGVWRMESGIYRLGAGSDPHVADTDGDGLLDGEEFALGTATRRADSDGDGLPDVHETRNTGTDPCRADSDFDGLDDTSELAIGTNPLQPDTDGDGMDDGWENKYNVYGFSSLDFAGEHEFPHTGIRDDLDGDGISNVEECAWGTNPGLADSDGDGVPDSAEIAQNSDPMDISDGGVANSRVPVTFIFGDPSGSQSEKYRLLIRPIEGPMTYDTAKTWQWVNQNYGECEMRTALLKRGWRYEIRLEHAGTDPSGDGCDYDYLLEYDDRHVPSCVLIEDPLSLFGSDYTSTEFAARGKVAYLTVYDVVVAICDPDSTTWSELPSSRVLLVDELFRVKVEVRPKVRSLEAFKGIFGESLRFHAAGMERSVVALPLDPCSFVPVANSEGWSQLKLSRTFSELYDAGVISSESEADVGEMAWLDMAELNSDSGMNLADSEAFSEIGLVDRGIACLDPSRTLYSSPPCSWPSTSYFQAAGREVVWVECAESPSRRKQVMSQADYFYFSGHGNHQHGTLVGQPGNFSTNGVINYWRHDLECAIFAGCAVLDIGDYNGNFSGADHLRSPGRDWETVGPPLLLGYNASAPGDAGGAPSRIMQSWLSNRDALGDVGAWMKANAENRAWNACAIVKGHKYVYFEKVFFNRFKRVKEIQKGEWR